MSPSRVDRWRRTIRWLSAGAIFAVVPKCFLCLAAYVGFGTLLGIKAAPEICGAASGPSGHAIAWAIVVGVTLTCVVIGQLRRNSRAT